MANDQNKGEQSPFSGAETIAMEMGNAVNQENAQIQEQLGQSNLMDNALRQLESFTTPATGEARPFFADGTSPATPVNESPISTEDRFKLSLGNRQGGINFLKNKYEDASTDSKGNIVVKDGGLWKRVDAEGLGSGDAWSRTQELLKDVVDIAPEAAAIGATLAVPITGGASAIALAGLKTAGALGATEGLRTSLGRAVGTYEADSVEQMQDIGLEALLGLGGVAIGAGIKPSIGLLKKGLSGAAKTLGKSTSATKDTMADVLGAATGMGSENVHRVFERGNFVGDILDKATKGAGSEAAAIDRITQQQIKGIKNIAISTRKALTETYDIKMNQMLPKVGNNFAAAERDFAAGHIDNFIAKGLLKKEGNKLVVSSADELIGLANSSNDEMIRAIGLDLSTDKGSYKILKAYLDSMTSLKTTSSTGTKGFKEAIQVDKKLRNAADVLKAKARSQKIEAKGIGSFIDDADAGLRTNFDNIISKKLTPDLAKEYSSLKSGYHKIADSIRPLLDVHTRSMKGGDKVYESFLGQIQAKAGKNITNKSSLDNAISTLSNTKAGKGISNNYNSILDSEAAKSVIPKINKSFVQFGAPIAAATSIAAGNPMAGLGLAATMAATSPRLAYKGIRAAQTFTKQFKGLPKPLQQSAVKGLFKNMEYIRGVAGKGQTKLLDDRSLQVLSQTMLQSIQGK